MPLQPSVDPITPDPATNNGHSRAHHYGTSTPPSPVSPTSHSSGHSALPFSHSTTAAPARFATSFNAFGLAGGASKSEGSPSTSSPSSQNGLQVSISGSAAAGSAGGGGMALSPTAMSGGGKRMRRPSMLSLAQNFSASSGDGDAESSTTAKAVKESPNSNENDIEDVSDGQGRRGDGITSNESVRSRSAVTQRFPPAFQSQQPSPFFTGPAQPIPRWGPFNTALPRTNSFPAIPMEGLKTSTPPVPATTKLESNSSGSASPMLMDEDGNASEPEHETETRSPLRWVPSHLETSSSRKKGLGLRRMDDDLISGFQNATASGSDATVPRPNQIHGPPFTGRPLPASLLATLMTESSPLEHEIQSEARLQRFLSSHPSALPLTPRPSRSSRGRFPEMVGGEDDEDDTMGRRRPSLWGANHRSWRGSYDSDSDSDDMPDDIGPEPVNAAFAAAMDMDRPSSSTSNSHWASGAISESGKSTPGHQQAASTRSVSIGSGSGSGNGSSGGTAAGNGAGAGNPANSAQHPNLPTPPMQSGQWAKSRMSLGNAGSALIPSPGNGFGLPSAFGGLAMGGIGTPLQSPTIEKTELAISPHAMSMSSPGLMAYRESQGGSASIRAGKRKAQVEDRYDPYKRSRGTSPGVATGFPMSPSRPSPLPIPSSPGGQHLSPFLSTSNPSRRTLSHTHPYTRPMVSRSRQASPALSIGSTSGILSGTLSNGNKLGGAFIPTGPAGTAAMAMANATRDGGPRELGGLGLLTLGKVEEGVGDNEEGEDDGEEVIREDDEEEAMEED